MLSRWQNPLLVLSECEGRVASLRLAPGAAALVRRGGRSHPASICAGIPLFTASTFQLSDSVTLQLSHSATFPVC
jgi:hypothetical protein